MSAMPGPYTQKNRPMAVKTKVLKEDALLIVSLVGQEALSQPFNYELKVLAPADQDVPFDKLLGQSITVEVQLPGSRSPREKKRFFNGMCSSISELGGDDDFTEYVLRLVPRVWLLTQRARSRIFQHKTVLEILEAVLFESKLGQDTTIQLSGVSGLDDHRDYCVQYRETDFNFLSRLLEEEGIYYYFVHEDGKHTMVMDNSPGGHREMPNGSNVLCSAGTTEDEDFVFSWSKTQEIRPRTYVLRDHCFELTTRPGRFDSLEVKKEGLASVKVGNVEHSLNVGGPELTIYDYPGEFAQRFDGIDTTGGEQADKLKNVQKDGERTAALRMEREKTPSLLICGSGTCRQFQTGHWFTRMIRDEDDRAPDGKFVLTAVSHQASQPGYRSTRESGTFRYVNTFTALPVGLPFRPPRRTTKPIVQGTQTAVVVGVSPDDDIFTDKYGRVKVQFHWDREGKFDADSSCWVRVATPLAGEGWGMIHIPRVGQEVIVGFEEGDPDRPIILGAVYNAGMMPPYTPLPDKRTQSGYKSRSTPKGEKTEFNELRFEDKKGEEKVYMHAQKDMEKVVENSYTLTVGPKNNLGPSHLLLVQSEKEQKLEAVVGPKSDHGACSFLLHQYQCSPVQTTLAIAIAPKHDYGPASIQMDQTLLEQKMVLQIGPKHDFGPASIAFDQTKLEQTLELKTGPGGLGPASIKFDKTMVTQYLELKLGSASIRLDQKPAMESIEIKVGDNSIKLDQMGVTIKGLMVKINGDVQTAVKGLITQVSADAMMQVKGAVTMIG